MKNGVICINGIKTYSYHGCLEEEAQIGGHYIVDVEILTDYSEASIKDNLSGTVDYCDVFAIVKREMGIRSKLIEHVADRISAAMKRELPAIEKVKVWVTKIVPPVNGDIGSVRVLGER
jgi:dihydroneopterin aldolase